MAQSAEDLRRLDVYIAEALEAWPVPGLAVAIVKNGEIVFEKGYGVREIGREEPVDENTLFAIASNTKAFTAAALAILVDSQKVSWDDRVRKFLPYFELYDPYVSNEMRIRDLLSHRSGLGTFSGDLLWYGTEYSAEEVVRRARYLEPTGQFRADYRYSNVMVIAAGEVVQAASGIPWSMFVREHIFEPSGMSRTVTSVRDLAGMENVATPHKPTRDGIVALEWYNWDSMAAAGGIISSVHDMAAWMEVQLNRGEIDGKRLFSREASQEMWRAHTPIPVSESTREMYPSTHFQAYGLGWSLMDYRSRKVVSHGGGYDGMYSRVVLVPEENLGVVVLTNSMTGITTAITNRVVDLYLGAEERDWSTELLVRYKIGAQRSSGRLEDIMHDRIPGTSPSLPLESFEGIYGGPMYGDASVTLEDGHLVLRLLPTRDFVADLTHLHFNTFLLKWRKEFAWFDEGTAHFLLDASGNVAEMKLDVPNNDLFFTELEFKRK